MRQDHSASPILLALLGIALLTFMDGVVKSLSADFPTFEIVFGRFAFGAFWIGLVLVMRRPGWPRREHFAAHAGRAALIVLSGASFFYALGALPMAEVFALAVTAPLFIAAFGALLLGESLSRRLLLAIGVGFVGVLVIVGGGLVQAQGVFAPLALAAALLAPVTYALGIVLLRAQTAHEPVAVIVFVQSIFVALFVAPVTAADFVVPGPWGLARFAAAGFLGATGYLAYAGALARTTAARSSVVEYTGLLWAALIGYFFFGEVPRLVVAFGAALIIGGCLIVLRERQAGKAA